MIMSAVLIESTARPDARPSRLLDLGVPGDRRLRTGDVMIYALWTIQVLLALLFLFAGGMKLILPIEKMTGSIPLPGWFLRFIGVAEVLGGLGLTLPTLLRIR